MNATHTDMTQKWPTWDEWCRMDAARERATLDREEEMPLWADGDDGDSLATQAMSLAAPKADIDRGGKRHDAFGNILPSRDSRPWKRNAAASISAYLGIDEWGELDTSKAQDKPASKATSNADMEIPWLHAAPAPAPKGHYLQRRANLAMAPSKQPQRSHNLAPFAPITLPTLDATYPKPRQEAQDLPRWTQETKQTASTLSAKLLAQSVDLEQPNSRQWCSRCQSVHAPWSACTGAAPYANNPCLMALHLERQRDAQIAAIGDCQTIPPRKARPCGLCPACKAGNAANCLAIQRNRRRCGKCSTCRDKERLTREFASLIREAKEQWDIETDVDDLAGEPPTITATEGCALCWQRYWRLAYYAARSAVFGRRAPDGSWRPGIAYLYLLREDGSLDRESAKELFGDVLARVTDFQGVGTTHLPQHRSAQSKSPQQSLRNATRNPVAYLYGLAQGYAKMGLASLSFQSRDSDIVESAMEQIRWQESDRPVESQAVGNVAASSLLSVASASLTPRQWQIVQLLSGGMPQEEAAKILKISQPMVAKHLAAIRRKLSG